MLVVHASLPVTNLKEFIAFARAKPGALDYASAGVGTSPHLAGEMFKTMAGIDLVHVPYKGNAEVANAIIGGHVKVYFSLVPASLQHVRNGTLRVLAVTTAQRLPYLPDVPTIAELGFPDYEITSWQGDVRTGRHAQGVVGKDQRRSGADAQDARGACAHGAGGRRPGRQHARSNLPRASRANSKNGRRWRRPPACRPPVTVERSASVSERRHAVTTGRRPAGR